MLSVDSTGMLISWNALTGKVIESFQSQNCSFGTVKKLNKRALLCSDANRDEIRIIQHSDGKDFKHLSTVKKVCGDSPIMNFAASQSVLVASSPLSNFIHVWDHDTLERKANFIQESTARGVLVNDEYIILGCDDGRIYIRKLRDMFSTASVIDLKPCAQYTDPILSMRIFFVSNDLVMAITRCIGFFLISIQDNKCVAHFQPDLSRNGSQSDPITATVLSDASVCYGGVGYCHIFNPPRRIQQLIDRSRRNKSDESKHDGSDLREKPGVIDVDAITDSEPASSSGRHGDDEYANGGGRKGIKDEERPEIGGNSNEGNTDDGLNTGLEDGRTKNSAHVNNCGEGSGKGELEKPLGDPSEMGNKRSEEEEGERKLQVEEEDLVSGVWKMRGEIEEEENERERMKCAIEKEERAMVSEETMRKALARQVEEKEMMQGILAEMEKMEAAAERRRKGESQRHDEEMSLLRKIIAENGEGGGGGDRDRLEEELRADREKVKSELETLKTDFEFLRNVVNVLIQDPKN